MCIWLLDSRELVVVVFVNVPVYFCSNYSSCSYEIWVISLKVLVHC